jgi:hypothetical protein
VEVPTQMNAEQRLAMEQQRARFPALGIAGPPREAPAPPGEKQGFFRGKRR